jgi:hypothetical protein
LPDQANTYGNKDQGRYDFQIGKDFGQVQAEGDMEKTDEGDQTIDEVKDSRGQTRRETVQKVALDGLRNHEDIHRAKGDGRKKTHDQPKKHEHASVLCPNLTLLISLVLLGRILGKHLPAL